MNEAETVVCKNLKYVVQSKKLLKNKPNQVDRRFMKIT